MGAINRAPTVGGINAAPTLPQPFQEIVRVIPAEFLFERRERSIVVDEQELDASDLREIFQVFGGEIKAEAGMMSTSGEDPGSWRQSSGRAAGARAHEQLEVWVVAHRLVHHRRH